MSHMSAIRALGTSQQLDKSAMFNTSTQSEAIAASLEPSKFKRTETWKCCRLSFGGADQRGEVGGNKQNFTGRLGGGGPPPEPLYDETAFDLSSDDDDGDDMGSPIVPHHSDLPRCQPTEVISAPSLVQEFRHDLHEEEQLELIQEYWAEKAEERFEKLKAFKTTPVRNGWTKRQQALTLAFIVAEAHRYQQDLANKSKREAAVQFTPRPPSNTRTKPLPNITPGAAGTAATRRLDLADSRVVAMLLHDVLVLVDGKQQIDRFEKVRQQLIGLSFWRPCHFPN